MSLVLDFGIEVEFLLKPKSVDMRQLMLEKGFRVEKNNSPNGKNENRRAFRMALVDLLSERIHVQLDYGGDYGKWTVADEISLDELDGCFRCEIVSAILSTHQPWRQQVDAVFSVILQHCDIHLTKGCSMHVHVSPNGSNYGVGQLRRILKGVIYYDGCLTKIMPPHRKRNSWAKSNVSANPAWSDAVEKVPQRTWEPLFNQFDTKTMIGALMHELPDRRYVAWNFSNILGGCGTVEFRRPPGVSSAAEAKHWAALALGYVANAMDLENWNAVKKTKTYPSTNQLRASIINGIGCLHSASHGALRQELMADTNAPPTPYTQAELHKIQQQKALKSQKKLSLFAEKVVNSRPNTPTGVMLK